MKEQLFKQAKAVADNIKKVREFRNYSQEYMAATLGISQASYCKLECVRIKITLNRLFHIAEILEVEVKILFSKESVLLLVFGADETA